MDLAEIARRQQAAREFTHAVDGAQFTLRTLTAHERRCVLMSLVALPAAGEAQPPRELGGEELEKLTRRITERSIVGWQGVTLAHLLPDLQADAAEASGAEPVPWSAAAVPLLLDQQPEWEKSLRAALAERSTPREEAIEADAKN